MLYTPIYRSARRLNIFAVPFLGVCNEACIACELRVTTRHAYLVAGGTVRRVARTMFSHVGQILIWIIYVDPLTSRYEMLCMIRAVHALDLADYTVCPHPAT